MSENRLQEQPDGGVYLGLALLAAAMLAFEVILTRLFALAQGHHFAFLAVSLALLGGGASGTFLTLRPLPHGRGRVWLTGCALLFTITAPASAAALNAIPFDAYRIAWEPIQLLWLTLYYLVLAVPFFFSGLAVGVGLVAWPHHANRIYGANLAGSGLGPVLALAGLAWVGGPGSLFLVSVLGAIATTTLARPWHQPADRRLIGALPALLVPISLLLALQPPPLANIRLTPYQPLSQALLYPNSQVIWQRWNAFSRVDLVQSAGIRSAPGLSLTYRGILPNQLGLAVDGQNISPISQVSAEQAAFSGYLPGTLAFQLRPNAETLIVEPGGGLAALTAVHNGASTVTAVQANPAVTEAVSNWGQGLYTGSRVQPVTDDARSYLHRHPGKYDLIVLPLTDSFRPVTAGAYTLGEDYRYTVEAFTELWQHLQPGGLLATERWLQLPPSESLRLWAAVLASLRAAGVETPSDHLIALRSMQTSLVLASQQPFTAAELERVRNFARDQQLDVITLPGLPYGEIDPQALADLGVNRYSVVAGAPYYTAFIDLLSADSPTNFYAGYEYAVAPPTDNRPYFFHFFKWRQVPQILGSLGTMWQPFGGTGYLVLVVLLALALLLASGLILLPLAVHRRTEGTGNASPYLAYFTLLGLGFLLVEIPLLGKFIVYLGQPAYAFAIVVSGLLVASGVGSRWLSPRLSIRMSLLLLIGLILTYPLLLDPLFQLTFGLPQAARAATAWLALLPLGLCLGLPFPQGLAVAEHQAPRLIPWLWAANGCASVISAVLASMIALDLGFRAVMLVGAAAYLGALAAARRWRS